MIHKANSGANCLRDLITFALLIAAFAPASCADSLFPVEQVSSKPGIASGRLSLFSDARALRVGDPLTVLIVENTSATSTANTKTSRDESVSGANSTGLFNRLFKKLNLTASTSRSGSGKGETSRTGALTTTLSVTVSEVLSNGTLRIKGTRLVGVNRELQRVTLTGIVRPEDISQDNAITSNLIAQAEIRYDGKGIVGDTQRPGLLTQIFRLIF